MESHIERTFKADEVRRILNDLADQEITAVEDVPESIEAFAACVVEEGTFTPDAKITAKLSLTLSERLTGSCNQDLTAMVILGMMLGSALERDVPMDSTLEDAWRDGAFVLPDQATNTDSNQAKETDQ